MLTYPDKITLRQLIVSRITTGLQLLGVKPFKEIVSTTERVTHQSEGNHNFTCVYDVGINDIKVRVFISPDAGGDGILLPAQQSDVGYNYTLRLTVDQKWFLGNRTGNLPNASYYTKYGCPDLDNYIWEFGCLIQENYTKERPQTTGILAEDGSFILRENLALNASELVEYYSKELASSTNSMPQDVLKPTIVVEPYEWLVIVSDGTLVTAPKATAVDNLDNYIPVKIERITTLPANAVGLHIFRYTAVDDSGNIDVREAVIEAITGEPTIEMMNSANMTVHATALWIGDPGAIATSYDGRPLEVTTSGIVDATTDGDYEIEYSATDNTLNPPQTRTVTRYVTVQLV